MKLFVQKRWILLLCLVGLVLALWGTNLPFVGIYNTNNNYLSLAARNFLRFGIIELKFLPTYFAGEHFTAASPYYLHHPVLVFWVEALALLAFGFHHFTVHIPQVLFVAGSVWLIYLIARMVWNEKVALWSAGLSAVFPMTTFFWKYMMFEQASMFFSLATFYFFLQYIQKRQWRSLFFIFMLTTLSGLSDWGVLYLLVPLGIFYFSQYRKHMFKPFFSYIKGTIFSLGIFGVAVYFIQHGFGELGGAIWGRSYTSELTGLSLWPVRLVGISILRLFVYFSPFAVVSGFYVIRRIQEQKKKLRMEDFVLISFFIYGLLNLLFLPAATWGHSYFLYYFVPFFAWAGALWLDRKEKKTSTIVFWVVVLVVTSITVNFFKIQQVKKQLWKYDVAYKVNAVLAPYETIGVINFPGDVFENYFFHPSQPISFQQVPFWLSGVDFPGVMQAVFVCAGPCTEGELRFAKKISAGYQVTVYHIRGNTAWLITKKPGVTPMDITVKSSDSVSVGEGNILLQFYRAARDFLGVGQI